MCVCVGPLATALSNMYGTRPVVMVGGFLSGLGLILASQATSLTHLYLTMGLITGTRAKIHGYLFFNFVLFTLKIPQSLSYCLPLSLPLFLTLSPSVHHSALSHTVSLYPSLSFSLLLSLYASLSYSLTVSLSPSLSSRPLQAWAGPSSSCPPLRR